MGLNTKNAKGWEQKVGSPTHVIIVAIMMSTQEHNLTLVPVMLSRDGAVITCDADSVFRHEVRDERGNLVGFVTNLRPKSFPASWCISLENEGQFIDVRGQHNTADEALSAMMKR
jgi:hypothetical protein